MGRMGKRSPGQCRTPGCSRKAAPLGHLCAPCALRQATIQAIAGVRPTERR